MALNIRLSVTARQELYTLNHNLSQSSLSAVRVEYGREFNRIIITAIRFEGNFGIGGNCSCLGFMKSNNVTLSSVLVRNNRCTGVTLLSIKCDHSGLAKCEQGFLNTRRSSSNAQLDRNSREQHHINQQ